MRVNGIFQKIFQTGEMSVCDICVYATEGSSRHQINGFTREILYLDFSLFCDVSSLDHVGCAFIFPLRLMICCLSTGQDGTWIVSAVPPSVVVRASCFLKYIRPLHPISSYYRSGHESPVQVLYTLHGYDFLLPWKHSRRFMFLIKNGSRVFSSHLSGIRLVLPVFEVKLKRRKKKTQVGNCSGNIFSSSLNACLLFLIVLVLHYSFHLVDGEQNSFGWLGRIGRSQRHVQHERRRPFIGCHGQSENSSVSNTLQSAFILRGKPTAGKEVFGFTLTVSKNKDKVGRYETFSSSTA